MLSCSDAAPWFHVALPHTKTRCTRASGMSTKTDLQQQNLHHRTSGRTTMHLMIDQATAAQRAASSMQDNRMLQQSSSGSASTPHHQALTGRPRCCQVLREQARSGSCWQMMAASTPARCWQAGHMATAASRCLRWARQHYSRHCSRPGPSMCFDCAGSASTARRRVSQTGASPASLSQAHAQPACSAALGSVVTWQTVTSISGAGARAGWRCSPDKVCVGAACPTRSPGAAVGDTDTSAVRVLQDAGCSELVLLYEGSWEQGRRQGRGMQHYRNGEWYEGAHQGGTGVVAWHGNSVQSNSVAWHCCMFLHRG